MRDLGTMAAARWGSAAEGLKLGFEVWRLGVELAIGDAGEIITSWGVVRSDKRAGEFVGMIRCDRIVYVIHLWYL